MSKRKSDEAYELLRGRIMCAELPPGAVIDERALIEETGFGRTPLREAVLMLEHEGLVVSLDRRGYMVAETSPTDLFRAYELRLEIECFAASRAAERRTESDLAAFDALIEEARAGMRVRIGDMLWNLRVDEEFHQLVVAASDNRFAAETLRHLFGLSVRSLYVSRIPATRVVEEIENYVAVFDAIRRRDPSGAAKAMARHLVFDPSDLLSPLPPRAVGIAE